MDRQLKERLIGAAVLVAAAVIMVPEMFSGSRETSTSVVDAAKPAANQLRTYRVELNSSPSATVVTPVEPPAERPLDEAAAAQAHAQSSVAPPVDEPTPQVAMNELPRQDAAPVPAVKPEVSRPEAAKPEVTKPVPVAEAKPSSGGWAVQVGSFSAQDKAQQIAGQLKGQGLAGFVAPVQVSGKTLYRVRVGGLRDRPSAEATLQKLRASYPGASVIAPGR